MELTELLQIKNPTMEQMAAAETLLAGIISESQVTLDTLADEERVRAKDRLIGIDDGGEARAAARKNAIKQHDDASSLRLDIMARMEAEKRRREQEAINKIWDEVQNNLIQRSEALRQIEALLEHVAVLYETAENSLLKARKLLPMQIDMRTYRVTQGGDVGQVAVAIVAKLDASIGSPIGAFQLDGHRVNAMARAVHFDSLAGFFAPADQFMMSHRG